MNQKSEPKRVGLRKGVAPRQQPAESEAEARPSSPHPPFQVDNLLDFLNTFTQPRELTAVVAFPKEHDGRRIAINLLATREEIGSFHSLADVIAVPFVDRRALDLMIEAAKYSIVNVNRFQFSLETLAISWPEAAVPLFGFAGLSGLGIMPCFVNGVRCGTTWYRLMAAKLALLKARRSELKADRDRKQNNLDKYKQQLKQDGKSDQDIADDPGVANMQDGIDALNTQINEIDRETDDLLGKDLKKSFNTLRKNLNARLNKAIAEKNAALAARNTPLAQDKSSEQDRLENDIKDLEKEKPE